jgi:transposase InsO family protein
MAATKSGQKVKAVRSDNCGEFTSQAFGNLLAENDTIHQLTAPYTPQEDGASEVLNKIIINTS